MNATTFQHYRIAAEYLGNKAAGWGDDGREENYNNHRVSVTNTKTKVRTSFEFWASLMNPELRSPSDLRGAFECFLSDAIAGDQSFHDFCSDFGYDEDSRKAEKTHRACQRSAAKAKRLIDGDLYDLANALRD